MSIIYIHRATKTPMSSLGGGEYSFGELTAGETLRFPLRFVREDLSGNTIEEDPDIRSLQASIGLVDARAEGGTLAYQIGSGPSTADNTTAEMPFNHTAQVLQDAINALTEIVEAYGLCRVVAVPGGFTIYWPEATEPIEIRARKNRVWPVSVVRSWAYKPDDEWVHEIRLVQAQLESTVNWPRVLPAAPKITAVRDGGVDSTGLIVWTEIQRIAFNPDFRGTYQIRRTDTGAKTRFLSRADGAEQVQAALQAIYEGEGTINVTNPNDGYGEIEFAGALAGVDVPLLEVLPGTAPAGDPTVTLKLSRPGVYAALRANPTATVYIEVKARIVEPGEDEEGPGEPKVLFRREVTLVRDQNFDEMMTLLEPLWLRDPNPMDYIPTTSDQVGIGTGYWNGPIGDGEHNVITIAHGQASEAIGSLVLRENVSEGAVLQEGVDYQWSVVDANSIRITFPTAPAEDAFYGVLMAAVPVTAWLPHTHTIAQIVELQDWMDEILGRVVNLESVLPSVGPAAASESAVGLITRIPEAPELFFYGDALPDGFLGENGPDASKLDPELVPPYLLGAVHDASVDEVTAVPASPTGNAGKVYKYTGTGYLMLPTGGWIPSAKVRQNEHFACDGRCFFKVEQQAGTNSFFPTAFDRIVVPPFACNDKMLRAGRKLELLFGVQTQLIGANSQAQHFLIVEKAAIVQATSPSPVGVNLASLDWSTIFECKIDHTPLLQSHYFGLRIARDGASSFRLDQCLYGVWEGNNAAAPESADFVLRASFGRFDIEDTVVAPRGFFFKRVIGGPPASESETSTTPQITIS